MEMLDTGIKGLHCVLDDTRCTYIKNGNELTFDGEYTGGEAWLNGKWHWWERNDSNVQIGTDASDEAVYIFKDNEEGWAEFANSVLG
jgi:hypothetical protein